MPTPWTDAQEPEFKQFSIEEVESFEEHAESVLKIRKLFFVLSIVATPLLWLPLGLWLSSITHGVYRNTETGDLRYRHWSGFDRFVRQFRRFLKSSRWILLAGALLAAAGAFDAKDIVLGFYVFLGIALVPALYFYGLLMGIGGAWELSRRGELAPWTTWASNRRVVLESTEGTAIEIDPPL